MLHKKLLWVLVFVPFVLLVIAGCSSEEESPVTPTPTVKPPTFSLKQVSFPSKMQSSTNTMAQQAMALVQNTMSFEGTGCVFAAPSGAKALLEEKTAWEYSWQDGNLTSRLAINLLGGLYKWQLFYTGTVNGTSYNDWRFMDVTQKSDLADGHVYVYKEKSTHIGQEWVWNTMQNKDYKFFRMSSIEPRYKVEITFSPDKSGKIDSYAPNSAGSLLYDIRFIWDAEGSGTWWTYQDGVKTDSGTW